MAQIDPDIIKAAGFGFRLLPGLVQSIEALFGKGNGASKKQAVQTLAQDAMIGAALGFGVSGDENTANVISSFAPVVSDSIDQIVSAFNTNKSWGATIPSGNGQGMAAKVS